MLPKTFKDDCLPEKGITEWYKIFKGKEPTVEDSRSGRQSTSTNQQHADQLKELVLSDCHDIIEQMPISFGSC